MMDTLPCSITRGQFLGSGDRIAVAGTVASHSTEVRTLGLESDDRNNEMGYCTTGTCRLPGSCTAAELCGISRVGKLLMAVATISTKAASVSFVDVGNSVDASSATNLNVYSRFGTEGYLPSAYTTISFDNFSGHVGLLSDVGAVSVVDVEKSLNFVEFIPDGTGLLDIVFSRSGKLLTLGNSARGQLQVWDIRGSTVGNAYNNCMTIRLPPAPYVRIIPHPVQEYCIFCGDTSGSIHEVDLRFGEISRSFKAHSDSVSDMTVCCANGVTPVLLSSSRDGSILKTTLDAHSTQSLLLKEPSLTRCCVDFDTESTLSLALLLLKSDGKNLVLTGELFALYSDNLVSLSKLMKK